MSGLRPENSGEPKRLGESVPASEWRKVHPITPILKGGVIWTVLAVGAYNFAFNLFEHDASSLTELLRNLTLQIVGYALLVLVGVTLVVIAASWVAWKFTSYAVVASGIHMRKGVLFKTHAHMRWDRVQGVEVQQRLLGRLFGFGSVKVESAGTEEPIELGMLKIADCHRLRSEILDSLARARVGLPLGEAAAAGVQGAEKAFALGAAGPASLGDELLYKLPTERLILARILTPTFFGGMMITVAATIGTIAAKTTPVIVVMGLLTTVYSWLKGGFAEFGTTVHNGKDGLRIRGGLTSTSTRAIPPQRLHALEIVQPLLWRRSDWWRVDPCVAGARMLDLEGGTVYPVASRSEVVRLLYTLLPAGDVTASMLQEAFEGKGSGRHFLGAGQRGRWFDPITLPARGICLTAELAVFRSGRFRRKIVVVWRDHAQSRTIKQGPIQAKFDLATLQLDVVGWQFAAPVAKNFSLGTVRELVQMI